VGWTGHHTDVPLVMLQNLDEEATFDVSNKMVDIGLEVILDPIMVNNPNDDGHEKSASESKESGKGVCVGV